MKQIQYSYSWQCVARLFGARRK